ncbi:MAG: hypothetical protein NC429_16575 [Lachnospiraceae bacterium]|nr:hypothetical protein [Lachnospiraceae bacterium]
MKLDKRSKIFIMVLFSIILVPVIIIGSINYTKEQKLKNRIENSKTTRILTLNNISTAITLDELFEIETSKEYTIEYHELKFENDPNKRDFDIEFTNTSIYGTHCVMEYFFIDEKLKSCLFKIDTSHWMPKDIYEELVKLNGEPDETNIDDKSFYLKTYIWYGKNGTITFDKLNNDTIELYFEIFE